MSKDAVKFGRMSKKQKAKVASELKQKNSEAAAEYAASLANAGANGYSSFSTNSASSSPPVMKLPSSSSSVSSTASSSPSAIVHSNSTNNVIIYNGPNNLSNSHAHLQMNNNSNYHGHMQATNGHLSQTQQATGHGIQTSSSSSSVQMMPHHAMNSSYANGQGSTNDYQQMGAYQQQQRQAGMAYAPIQTQYSAPMQQQQGQLAQQQHYPSAGQQIPLAPMANGGQNGSIIDSTSNQYNYDLGLMAKHVFDAHMRTFSCFFDYNEMNRIIQQNLNVPSTSSSEFQRILGMVRENKECKRLADKQPYLIDVFSFSEQVSTLHRISRQSDQLRTTSD